MSFELTRRRFLRGSLGGVAFGLGLPVFDAFLNDSIRKETEAFLKELIVSNLPVSNVVKSDFAMLNSRLADHYGLDSVDGVAIALTNALDVVLGTY